MRIVAARDRLVSGVLRETDAGARPGAPGPSPLPRRKEAQAAVDQPQRIGKYIVVEMLDSGGQAEVFRVVHPELAKECALKLARRPMAMEDQAGRDALTSRGAAAGPVRTSQPGAGHRPWMSTKGAGSWSWSTSRG